MARKIRFPLQMKNGVQVRTLEELRENFYLESVLGYFENGKLATWLKDRYYDELAESICQLNPADENLNKKLCDLLGVVFSKRMSAVKLDTVIQRNEKLNQVRQITDNEEIIASFSTVAFNQAELEELLKQSNVKTIYVHGDHFHLPLVKRAVRIVGIANPQIDFGSRKFSEYKKYGITIENAQYKKLEWEEKEVGDTFAFGQYMGEPIEWLILKKNPNSIFVISLNVLDIRSWHKRIYSHHGRYPWESSEIRQWLNQTFFNSAFKAEEKSQIILTNLDDVQTKDKVFLLSYDEARELLVNEKWRIMHFTKYAEQIINQNKVKYRNSGRWNDYSRGETDWGLRTPSPCSTEGHMTVYRNQVEHHCRVLAWEASGIRPAMYLNID